jgi:transposase
MKPKPKSKNQRKLKAIVPQPLAPINLNTAGIDVGSTEIFVAVPMDRDAEPIRTFLTFTADILEMAQWLLRCGITSVAMESTGVYWIPIYDILESCGIEVCLIDPRRMTRNKKTDILDCQHLQQQHCYGQLDPSFRPPLEIRCIRTVSRQHEMLLKGRASHIQHMQKSLHEMNIQLDNVLKDITGVTGMTIIRAIVGGEHNPVTLAQHRDPRCKHSKEDIIKSLEGTYLDEHLFALEQDLRLYDEYSKMLLECDEKLMQLYACFETSPFCDDTIPTTAKARKRRKHDPNQELRMRLYQLCGVDLTEIDGLDCTSVQTVLSEIGTNVSPWPTMKQFTAWTTLAPNNRISGGKILSSKKRKSSNRVALEFRLAARSVANSSTALGSYYRRVRAKHGPAQANTATAHKIARIFYTMLKTHTPYQSVDQNYYEQQYQDRIVRNLKRTASKFNLRVIPIDSNTQEYLNA